MSETWSLESSLQSAVAKFLDDVLDHSLVRWTHIASGGKRNIVTARNLKRQGVKPGWPDVIILYMGRVLMIELKRTRETRISPAQRDFASWANDNGLPTVICRSLGGVEKALKQYGVPVRMRAA